MKKRLQLLLFMAVCSTAQAQSTDVKSIIKENPVLIGQQRSTTVHKGEIMIDPVLRLPETNKNYHITGFEISYLPKGKGNDILGPYIIKGDNLTIGHAADILNRLEPGDRIFFENITAVSNNPKEHPLKLAAAIKVE